MIKLNKRLACIASFCKDNLNIIDVGCDHAFLSIYIKQKYKNTKILASDINIKPLMSAKENIKKYNLDEEIDTIIMDGIDYIPDYINTIIISGMGAILMRNILKKEKLKNIDSIILSPNNDFDIARRHLTNIGYYIDNEEMVEEKGKFYPVIIFKKGYKKYTDIEIKYGPILINKKKDTFIKYLEFKRLEYNNILKNIDENNIKYKELTNELEIIKKILES